MKFLGRAWAMIGLFLLLTAAMEIGATILRAALQSPDLRPTADAYHDVDWSRDYFEEFHRTQVMRWEPFAYWRRVPFEGRFINVDERGIRRTWRRPGDAQGDEETYRRRRRRPGVDCRHRRRR